MDVLLTQVTVHQQGSLAEFLGQGESQVNGGDCFSFAGQCAGYHDRVAAFPLHPLQDLGAQYPVEFHFGRVGLIGYTPVLLQDPGVEPGRTGHAVDGR